MYGMNLKTVSYPSINVSFKPTSKLVSPDSTSEIFSDKKDSSHFKSELDEKYTNQSDKEDGEDSDEMILVPYEFQGDGRKREAKRHKSRTAIP